MCRTVSGSRVPTTKQRMAKGCRKAAERGLRSMVSKDGGKTSSPGTAVTARPRPVRGGARRIGVTWMTSATSPSRTGVIVLGGTTSGVMAVTRAAAATAKKSEMAADITD